LCDTNKIGAAFAVVCPLLTIVIFTFIFSRVAKMPSESGAPYPTVLAP
jgi:lipopolysaccharide transport system permease protein